MTDPYKATWFDHLLKGLIIVCGLGMAATFYRACTVVSLPNIPRTVCETYDATPTRKVTIWQFDKGGNCFAEFAHDWAQVQCPKECWEGDEQ